MSQKLAVHLTINGQPITAKVSAQRSLADFLHEQLGLSGTKVCCGMGICKACTVAVKRPGTKALQRAQACIMPVSALEGSEVTTVEGLSQHGEPSVLQTAFLEHFAFQCGYSTPGFLMGATLLIDQLKHKPIKRDDLDQTIAESLADHICRCTGYVRYYAAIKAVILGTPGLVLG